MDSGFLPCLHTSSLLQLNRLLVNLDTSMSAGLKIGFSVLNVKPWFRVDTSVTPSNIRFLFDLRQVCELNWFYINPSSVKNT